MLNHKEKPMLHQTNDLSILMRFFFSLKSYKSKTKHMKMTDFRRGAFKPLIISNKKMNSFIYLANIIYS